MDTTTRCATALLAAVSVCVLAGCSSSATRGAGATSPLLAFAVPATHVDARLMQPRSRFDDLPRARFDEMYFIRASLVWRPERDFSKRRH